MKRNNKVRLDKSIIVSLMNFFISTILLAMVAKFHPSLCSKFILQLLNDYIPSHKDFMLMAHLLLFGL